MAFPAAGMKRGEEGKADYLKIGGRQQIIAGLKGRQSLIKQCVVLHAERERVYVIGVKKHLLRLKLHQPKIPLFFGTPVSERAVCICKNKIVGSNLKTFFAHFQSAVSLHGIKKDIFIRVNDMMVDKIGGICKELINGADT